MNQRTYKSELIKIKFLLRANTDFAALDFPSVLINLHINFRRNSFYKDLTITLYGARELDKDVATDGDVFLIEDSELIVPTTETAYEVTGDKFPYYIVRCNFPVAPDDDPAEEVTVFAESRES